MVIAIFVSPPQIDPSDAPRLRHLDDPAIAPDAPWPGKVSTESRSCPRWGAGMATHTPSAICMRSVGNRSLRLRPERLCASRARFTGDSSAVLDMPRSLRYPAASPQRTPLPGS
jgi:hypothetical protein